jgi:hypothetical protein
LTKVQQKVADLYAEADNPRAFAAALYREGLTVARVDEAGLARMAQDKQEAAEKGLTLRQPKLYEGDLAAVNRFGGVHSLMSARLDADKLEAVLTFGAREIPDLGPTIDYVRSERAADKAAAEKASHDRQEAKADREAKAQEDWKEKAEQRAPRSDPVQQPIKAVKQSAFVVAEIVGGPVQSLMDFLSSLGDSPKPPPPKDQVEQFKQQRRALAAVENIHRSVTRGERIVAEDIRSLLPTQIENLKAHCDDYLRELIESFERQQRREREEREYGGRERER